MGSYSLAGGTKRYLGYVRWYSTPSPAKFAFMANDPEEALEKLRRFAGVQAITSLHSFELLEAVPGQKDAFLAVARKEPRNSTQIADKPEPQPLTKETETPPAKPEVSAPLAEATYTNYSTAMAA